MSEQAFDVIIIGAGPGGYTMAIRCAQLGMNTAVVEKDAGLGGTCTNVGCIPSKALLHSSELYHTAAHGFTQHGIKIAGKIDIDLPAMMAQKQSVVTASNKGIEFLFKKNKITLLKGFGKLLGGGKVEVDGESKGTYSAKHIVIATGSEVTPLKGIEIDEKQVVSSTGALKLPSVPKSMVVIGGGVIGLELGSVWLRLGAEVTVVEFLDRILPTNDGEVSKQMQRILAKQGMKFKLGTKVTAAKPGKTGVTLTMEPAAGGDKEEVAADVVLVSIGRRPFTTGLGLPPACSSTSAAASRPTVISTRRPRASMRSAMPSSGRCWRIRRMKRAWCWRRCWPARSRISTTTPFPAWSTPYRKSPAWARPRKSSRLPAWLTRPASSRSPRMPARAP